MRQATKTSTMAELTLNVPSIQLSQPPSSNPNNTNRKLWFACVLLGLYAFSTIGDKAEIITQGRLIIQQDKYIEFVDSRLVSATSELSGTKKDLGECRGSLSDCKTAYASCDKSLVAAQDQVKKDASTIRLRTARLKEVTELLEQEERNHTGTRNDLLVSQAERARADDSIGVLNKAIMARDEVIADYDDASSLSGFFAALFGSVEEEATATHPPKLQAHASKLVSATTLAKASTPELPQPDHTAKVQQVRENAFSWAPIYFLLVYFGLLLLLLFVLLRRSARKRKRWFFGF